MQQPPPYNQWQQPQWPPQQQPWQPQPQSDPPPWQDQPSSGYPPQQQPFYPPMQPPPWQQPYSPGQWGPQQQYYPPPGPYPYPYPYPPPMMPQVAMQTNVIVQQQPTYQREQLSFLVRALYFCFIGWWLGIVWATFALTLIFTIIGAPIGILMLTMLPTIMTLYQK